MSSTSEPAFPVQTLAFLLFGEAGIAGGGLGRQLAVQAKVSISQERNYLACAYGQRLAIAERAVHKEGPCSGGVCNALGTNETITALAWISSAALTLTQDKQICCLLVGTSLGYLQWHSVNNEVLARQRLHQSACCSISWRQRAQGLNSGDSSEDLTIGFCRGAVRISAIEVLSFFTQISSLAEGGDSRSIPVLSHTKWEFPRSTGKRHAAICSGMKPPTLQERMLGRFSGSKVLILTGGESPSLATYEAPEWGNEGVMAVVSELASGVAGLAKTLMIGRTNGYRAGLGSWLGRSSQNKSESPEAVETQPGHTSSLSLSVQDEARIVTSVVPAPSSMTVLRVWKSYRHAQVGWLSTSPQGGGICNLLVLYHPKRATMEIWKPMGTQTADIPACRYGNLQNLACEAAKTSVAAEPCLLDCETGLVKEVRTHL